MIISEGDFIHEYGQNRPTRLLHPGHRIEEVKVVQALDLRPGDRVHRRVTGLRETALVLSGWEEAEYLVNIRYTDGKHADPGTGVVMTDKGPMIVSLHRYVMRELREDD